MEMILKDGGVYIISYTMIDYWQSLFPDLDVFGELLFIKKEFENNESKRKTSRNITKYITNRLYDLNNGEIK